MTDKPQADKSLYEVVAEHEAAKMLARPRACLDCRTHDICVAQETLGAFIVAVRQVIPGPRAADIDQKIKALREEMAQHCEHFMPRGD